MNARIKPRVRPLRCARPGRKRPLAATQNNTANRKRAVSLLCVRLCLAFFVGGLPLGTTRSQVLETEKKKWVHTTGRRRYPLLCALRSPISGSRFFFPSMHDQTGLSTRPPSPILHSYRVFPLSLSLSFSLFRVVHWVRAAELRELPAKKKKKNGCTNALVDPFGDIERSARCTENA